MMKNILYVMFVLNITMTCCALAAVTGWGRNTINAHHNQQQQQKIPQRQDVATRETNTCEERKTSGPICESCELLSTCLRHSNGWVNIPVETCDTQNGFYCNSRLGMCSNATGPCHPFGFEGNFQCTSHGIFPDPYDCQKYHVCHFIGATLVAATVDCVGNTAFNAATGQCSLTLDHPVCRQKQFTCRNAGDANAWTSNPNIFYICKATSNQDQERVVYPSLYRCADGEIFDGYYCTSTMDTSTHTTDKVETSSVSDSPPWATSTSTLSPSLPPVPTVRTCREVGLAADPENCHQYYYCSGVNGILKLLECPTGTFYNPMLSSCTLGTC